MTLASPLMRPLRNALVLELEEPFRTSMLLRYYEGHSSREVARMVGVPERTDRGGERVPRADSAEA